MSGRADCIKKAKVVTEAASSLLTGPSSGFLSHGGGAFSDCCIFTVFCIRAAGSKAGGESSSAGQGELTLSSTVT